jgi:hypothetical protein
MDARLQLFDLKTKYQFQTSPGVDRYNMPLYAVQTEPGAQNISYYPVYQGFTGNARISGVPVSFSTEPNNFYNNWSTYIQPTSGSAIGDGTAGPYTINLPFGTNVTTSVNQTAASIVRGHVDMSGIIATQATPLLDPPVTSTFLTTIPVTSVFPAVYITSTDETGANVVVSDSGQFLTGNVNYGLLMSPGSAPFGNTALPGGYNSSSTITGATQANPCVLTSVNSFVAGQAVTISGVVGMTQLNGNTYTVLAATSTTITIEVNSTSFTAYSSGGVATSNGNNLVNYITGQINVIFPVAIPAGQNITAQATYYNPGLPRAILYYNNVITLRTIPYTQYLVELDAYLSPAAFLSTTQSVPFGYMSEYLARGAARKILSDTGDVEQFMFYEPLFREQEMLVWKRSQRQFTSTRTQTLFSNQMGTNGTGNNNTGIGLFS